MVFIQNIEGKPLMPTDRHGKVKHLLKAGKAKVVKKRPFTIRLEYETGNFVQPITLGVDPGAKTMGLSASTEKKELFSAQVILRDTIKELLARRKACRQHRRYRKVRFRKARFLNKSIPKGWLPPSVKHKVDTHLRMIEKVYEILPINQIVFEVASFDVHKMQNPDIQGKEYQNGVQKDFWNTREYVLYRDGHICQMCAGKSKNPVLQIHHIESRRIGGNAPDNLICLCKSCHDKVHQEGAPIKKKAVRKYKDATFMNLVRNRIFKMLKEKYPNVSATYGYITKSTRIENGLPKEHHIDALCIAGHPKAKQCDTRYVYQKVRCHNRVLHRIAFSKGGVRRRAQVGYEMFGFQLNDRVSAEGKEYYIAGRLASGQFTLKNLSGEKITKMHHKLRLMAHQRGYIIEQQNRVQHSVSGGNLALVSH